jgi:hypothetical protein
VEPEGSLPCSQDPATGSCSHMNLVHVKTPCSFKISFNIILLYICYFLPNADILLSSLKPSFYILGMWNIRFLRLTQENSLELMSLLSSMQTAGWKHKHTSACQWWLSLPSFFSHSDKGYGPRTDFPQIL